MTDQQALQILKSVQDAAVQRGGIFQNTEEASQALVAFKKVMDAVKKAANEVKEASE